MAQQDDKTKLDYNSFDEPCRSCRHKHTETYGWPCRSCLYDGRGSCEGTALINHYIDCNIPKKY